jgi:ferredoxin
MVAAPGAMTAGSSATDGIAPCVHALGLRDLARLAAAGCRRLIVSTGDCDACPRGAAVRLETRLAELARLLDSRGLPILRLERLPADRWQAARDALSPDAGPAMGRRAFLRRGLGMAVDHAASAFGLAAAERDGIETAARLLPETGQPGALAPIGPRIDAMACTGCDACVQLCPQHAIQLERECTAGGRLEDPSGDRVVAVGSGDPVRDGSVGAAAGRSGFGSGARQEAGGAGAPESLAYRILPNACTGCGICVDVCADDAVRLEAWLSAAPIDVPLTEATCARCRVRFHRPVIDIGQGPAHCPI